jgi:hypothetical protein
MADKFDKNSVPNTAHSTVGQYPFSTPFEVEEALANPGNLDVNRTVPDSVMPKFPPKGHLVDATDNFDEAAWGMSETLRSQKQQGRGTIKRSND